MLLPKLFIFVGAVVCFPLIGLSKENSIDIFPEESSYSKSSDELKIINGERIPSAIEGASIARTLVFRESLTNVNTFKTVSLKNGELKVPVSSVEYYADCDNDGDFYWLVVDIGSTFQNIKLGSDYSFTIRVGDHHLGDEVNPEYPGGIVNSPAGSPRVNLHGILRTVEDKDGKYDKLEKCFLERHPDSKLWIPGKSKSHSSHWTKLEVDDVYVIGGFGDRAYIGSIDAGIYHSVTTLDDH